MELFIDDLINWIFTLSPWSIYTIFFIVAYLENIIPPVPGDILVAFGGYLAAEKLVDFTTLLLFTTIASVIGFMSMYGFGSFGDTELMQKEKSSG
jgi:membrane protein DedA with SNARE-associated domain